MQAETTIGEFAHNASEICNTWANSQVSDLCLLSARKIDTG